MFYLQISYLQIFTTVKITASSGVIPTHISQISQLQLQAVIYQHTVLSVKVVHNTEELVAFRRELGWEVKPQWGSCHLVFTDSVSWRHSFHMIPPCLATFKYSCDIGRRTKKHLEKVAASRFIVDLNDKLDCQWSADNDIWPEIELSSTHIHVAGSI